MDVPSAEEEGMTAMDVSLVTGGQEAFVCDVGYILSLWKYFLRHNEFEIPSPSNGCVGL